jgi:DNA polymerase alpha subunit A
VDYAGLDPGRYRNITSSGQSERSFLSLDSQISDKERFKDADPFLVRCRHCHEQQTFGPIIEREVRLFFRYSNPNMT